MEIALDEIRAPYDTVAYLTEQAKHGVVTGGLSVTRYQESTSDFVSAAKFFPEPDRTIVFRLNGPVIRQGRDPGVYAITEEDQIDLILGLRTTLPILGGQMHDRRLLSLGHSTQEWPQRALFQTLLVEKERRRGWAVALNPAILSVATWQRYDIEVYNLDLNEWAARMREAGAT
jgi:hypothetical protein